VRSAIVTGGPLVSVVECRAKRRRNRHFDHVAGAYNRRRLKKPALRERRARPLNNSSHPTR
jgi:hypothetical protein